MRKPRSRQEVEEAVRTLREYAAKTREDADYAEIVDLKSLAAEALSEHVMTPTFLLDMWKESAGDGAAAEAMEEAAAELEKLIATKEAPDDLEKILRGEEFGVVSVPSGLLRELWGLGEAVLNLRERKANGEPVERRTLKVLHAAAGWVQCARDRWGTQPRLELTAVAPDPAQAVPPEATGELPF